MAQQRRFMLRHEAVEVLEADDFPERVEAALAACPEAAAFSDEEAEDFLMTIYLLETGPVEAIRGCMRRAGLVVPPEISFDEYRLGRHIFRRWGDPSVRAKIIAHSVPLEERSLARFMRRRDPETVREMARHFSAPVALALFRKYGVPELAPIVLAELNEEGHVRYRRFLAYVKTVMHRFITEPEPPRRPTRWDRAKLARRLQLREVQMRAMRKSVHSLRRERKALMTRLRELSQQEEPELQSLAGRLAALRADRAEVERRFAAERNERAGQYQATLDCLRTDLVRVQQELAATLAERQQWLSAERSCRDDHL